MNSTLQYARAYRGSDINLLAIKADGSKSPAPECLVEGGWKYLQLRTITDDELVRFFSNGNGLAAIGGAVSGHLEAIDFDDLEIHEIWRDLVREYLGNQFLDRLLIVRTPRPGVHVVTRCPTGVGGSQKLAQFKIPNPEYDSTKKGSPQEIIKTLIETKAAGGYFLLPGCPPVCHETGRLYELVQGSFASIPVITAEEREILLSCARCLCRMVREEHPTQQSSRTRTDRSVAMPGDDFNGRGTGWTELLTPYGFTLRSQRGEVSYWTRPGKDHGVSATTNHAGSNLFYAFSTNCHPFDNNRGYSKFAVYTLLSHAGDFNAAAQELKRQGYGHQLSKSNDKATVTMSPWDAAIPACDFIAAEEEIVDWIDYPFLARGSVTEVFSPRGIGKTQVSLAKGVHLARKGYRVLLLDRDNPPSEVRRRLKAWGAENLTTLKVLTRHQIPPLTDYAAWALFPFNDYDVVILDALDSSAEGVGEKDSSKPSRAIAPLLDIARQTNGPAILVLGNTIKSGQNSRGSGIIEDRADICFEVRDATSFTPTGQRPWWEELPASGTDAWAQRSTRRQKRDKYRLAFIPSKFRIGEEPNPFVLEINLEEGNWTLREVTDEMTQAGVDAHERDHQKKAQDLWAAVAALSQWVREQTDQGTSVLVDRDAVPYLRKHKLTRADAREAIDQYDGKLWSVITADHKRGQPQILIPFEAPEGDNRGTAAEICQSETLQSSITYNGGISADPVNIDRRKSIVSAPASVLGSTEGGLFPPNSNEQSEWTEKI